IQKERESYAREKRRRSDGEGADLIFSYDSDCRWCTFRYNACSPWKLESLDLSPDSRQRSLGKQIA
ncbi:hypothetical protein IGI04_027069, partial [Brassica rapa subsp. trilocularis]